MVRSIRVFDTGSDLHTETSFGVEATVGIIEITAPVSNRIQKVQSAQCNIAATQNLYLIAHEAIIEIDTCGIANPGVVNLDDPHGKTGTFNVLILGSDTTPSIDGIHVATVTDADSFTIPVNITGAGTGVGTIAVEGEFLCGASGAGIQGLGGWVPTPAVLCTAGKGFAIGAQPLAATPAGVAKIDRRK